VALATTHAITKQLADEFDVGRLATAYAGAGEFEQRLQQHRPLIVVSLTNRRSNSGKLRKNSS